MKMLKLALPLLALLALGVVLTGCPKGDKMMKNDTGKPGVVELIG